MKTMKTKNMFWAALSMTAALVMTACSSDNDLTETPAAPQAKKTIPYTVTVSDAAATTRATVSDDPTNRQLYFASGDQLYITGTDIKGVLDLQAGDEGKATGATFSGELTYSGSGSPADDLSLTATLVSAQQTVGTQVSVDAAGAVTVNYPSTAYCATISDAVQQYSRLTGTSTYGAKAFTLTQQTAFLNFEITFDDGTAAGETLSAVVSNGGSAVCTANVTTATESEKVVAKFVLPLAAGTTLSSATVTMGDKEAISFGASQTLTGKVYNVRKTLAAASPYAVGKIIGANGNIYASATAAEADNTTALAMIAYVGDDAETSSSNTTFKNGLALALEDVSVEKTWCSQTSATCLGTQYTSKFDDLAGIANTDALVNYTGHTHDAASAARNYNSGTHPTGTSAWFLPSAGQWQKMIDAVGLSNLGLEDRGYYWSSTERNARTAWYFSSGSGSWSTHAKDDGRLVRACLAF